MTAIPFTYGLYSELVTPTWSLTSEDSEFPASNIGDFTDEFIPQPGLSTVTIDDAIGDFGSATRVDWAIIQHNFTSGLSGVQFQMNASNSWGSPTVSKTLVIPAKRKNGHTVKVFVDVTAISGYTTSGLRWVRIHIPNANNAPIGLKVMLFSRKRQFNQNVKVGFRPQRNVMGIEHTTSFGITWHYRKLVAPRTLICTVDASDTAYTDMVDWFEDSDGRPVGMAAVDPNNASLEAYIVRLRSGGASGLLNASGEIVTNLDPTLRPGGAAYNPIQFTGEEVSVGSPEWE